MSTVDIHANELAQAVSTPGSYRINGVQDNPGDTLTIRQTVELLPGAGAVVKDRIVLAADNITIGAPRDLLRQWDSIVRPLAQAAKDPAALEAVLRSDTVKQADALLDAAGVTPDGLVFDGSTGPNTGPSSFTIDGKNALVAGATIVNGYRGVAVNPNQTATGLLLKRIKAHAIGKRYTSAAAAGSEAWQWVDGTWVNNHDQGLYMNCTGALVDEVECWDAAVRALQMRGSQGCRVMRFFGRDSGQLVMFGDLAAAGNVVHGVFVDHTAKTRAAIAEYKPGSPNSIGGYGFVTDGRPLIQSGSFKTTLVNANPGYDRSTGRLKAGSPAAGLVPVWMNAVSATPPPPPPPPSDSLPVTHTEANGILVLAWTPVPGAGYELWIDGQRQKSFTRDPDKKTWRVAKQAGSHTYEVRAVDYGVKGSVTA